MRTADEACPIALAAAAILRAALSNAKKCWVLETPAVIKDIERKKEAGSE